MSILVISQHYRPEPNFITQDVAEHLAARVPVTVITSHPHYPLGRFYDGTRWWWPSASLENGVRVYRVPMFPDRSRSVWRRLLSYSSFALMAGLTALVVGGRPTVTWVYQGPFTTWLASLWQRYARGSRLVVTCADLWPESFTASGVVQDGVVTRLAFAFRRWANRQADLIIGSTRGTVAVLAQEGIPESRLAYVPVWTSARPDGSGEPSPSPVIVYAGNIGPAQALEVVIRGAASLNSSGTNGIEFHLYGTGSDEKRLRALAAELKATNVRFCGVASAEQVFQACAGAVAQIISLRPSPQFRYTVPSKLGFSLAAGAPVLYALDGEARDILQSTSGGFPFDSGDIDSFVRAVRDVLLLSAIERRRIRDSLRQEYASHFSPDTLLARYEQLLLGRTE